MNQAAPIAGCLASPRDGGDLATARVGGKAGGLAALGALGVAVPPWFALTTAAFEHALGPALAACEAELSALAADPERVGEASAVLAARVAALAPPASLRAAVAEALARHFAPGAWLAVRSSAVDEDGAAHAMAGLMDSFLGVRGEDALWRAIRACWASAFSARALAYRLRRGLPLAGLRPAVVVQAMAEGDVSGVAFTANPVSGRRGEALVSAVLGLGEGLVSGALDADHWVLDRETGAISPAIADKPERIVAHPAGGTVRVPVPAALRQAPALSEAQVRAVAAIADRIAAARGCPQDVEFTLVDGAIVVLQARAITTLPPAPAGHRRMWDCSNIAESYPGVTTPLTYTFVRGVYEVAYQVMLRAFGVSERWIRGRPALFRNLLGYMNGRIYYNLTEYYRLGEFFPAKDALKDAFDTMIGVEQRKPHALRSLLRSLPQMAVVAAMIAWRYMDWDRENARFDRHFRAIFARFEAMPFDRMSPDALLDAYRELERDLLWHWRAPMVNDFYAMVFFGALRKGVARWGIDGTGAIANDLLCGEGDIESTAPIGEVRALADRVRRDPALLALYEGPLEAIQPALDAHPAFREALAGYLARYGFRCMGELKLEVPNFRDDPTFVHAMIRQYAQMPPHQEGPTALEPNGDAIFFPPPLAGGVAAGRGGGPGGASEDHDPFGGADVPHPALTGTPPAGGGEKRIRAAAEAAVAAALSRHPLRRALFGWILKNARRGVRGRENLRMARSNTFGIIRALFLGLGRQLAASGALDRPEDVFYMELGELFAYVEGRATTTDLPALVALRRAQHAAWEAESVPVTLETVGSPYLGGQLGAAGPAMTGTGALQGTGCCPGRVTATARVVLTPEPDTRLAGEILVTERTDPGWVLLYPLASGLLIERGSLLSHAAVTARELGLPTIIGVEGLTRRVKDGMRLAMDGAAGTVTILEEAPEWP